MEFPIDVWLHIRRCVSGNKADWQNKFAPCLKEINNCFEHDLLTKIWRASNNSIYKYSHVVVHYERHSPRRHVYITKIA